MANHCLLGTWTTKIYARAITAISLYKLRKCLLGTLKIRNTWYWELYVIKCNKLSVVVRVLITYTFINFSFNWKQFSYFFKLIFFANLNYTTPRCALMHFDMHAIYTAIILSNKHVYLNWFVVTIATDDIILHCGYAQQIHVLPVSIRDCTSVLPSITFHNLAGDLRVFLNINSWYSQNMNIFKRKSIYFLLTRWQNKQIKLHVLSF